MHLSKAPRLGSKDRSLLTSEKRRVPGVQLGTRRFAEGEEKLGKWASTSRRTAPDYFRWWKGEAERRDP